MTQFQNTQNNRKQNNVNQKFQFFIFKHTLFPQKHTQKPGKKKFFLFKSKWTFFPNVPVARCVCFSIVHQTYNLLLLFFVKLGLIMIDITINIFLLQIIYMYVCIYVWFYISSYYIFKFPPTPLLLGIIYLLCL